MRLRRLQPDEVEPLRELRLRALREDPGAFAETLEEARARPLEDWARWAADESRVIVVAVDGDRWAGMVAGRLLDGTTWLSALWVDPSVRGAGLGLRLIDAVADWAAEQRRGDDRAVGHDQQRRGRRALRLRRLHRDRPAPAAACRSLPHGGVPQPVRTALSTSGPWRRGLPSAGSSDTEMLV